MTIKSNILIVGRRPNLPFVSFRWFFILNLIFFSIQLFYITFQSKHFIQTIPLPNVVYFELLTTLCIHIGLYGILSFIQTIFLWGMSQTFLFKANTTVYLKVVIFSTTIGLLLLSNSYFYPMSRFSISFNYLLVLLISFLVLFSVFMLTAFWSILKLSPNNILFCCSLLIGCLSPPLSVIPAHQNHPNIILIGIDSLPPYLINKKNTPTIEKFTHASVLFQETITPLARTYPSWTTILTGLYPYHHGAYYNLMPRSKVQSNQSIAWDLKNKHFETVFATDDRRFNNLGEEFGFEHIIGPKVGVNDFLIGTFNDFPLSNLLINTHIAQILFPYNYMNRASFFTYYPQTFDNALAQWLRLRKINKPLFLAVHFTLPHWPYAFASSKPKTQRLQLFQIAIHQADQQVAHLLKHLKQFGYLNNSLVILLSDHGETLYTKGSRQTKADAYQGSDLNKLITYFKNNTATTLDQSAGHGSDLLSKDQYHCLLSIKQYEHKKLRTPIKKVTTRVALIDINPTIWAYLHQPLPHPSDGISLFNTLIHSKPLPERTFIMESGLLPNQFLSPKKAYELGSRYFMVDKKTAQLHLKNTQLPTLNAMKLFAMIKGDWVLAFYPDKNGYIPITQRLSDGAWTDESDSAFANQSSLHQRKY